MIEYNARFGDPECQVLMLRLKSDLLTALLATADGALATFDLRWSDDVALTVVMAAKGYPGDYARGTVIRGLETALATGDVFLTTVAARLYTMGVENVPMTPAQLGEFQRAELVKWAKIVKDGNVKPE